MSRLHPPRTVHIHYLRPPDRTDVFVQRLVHDDGRAKVTFASGLRLDRPILIDGAVALENDSEAVWFTFPGAWHDIGRFHRADGSLTGIYANVLTPCVFEPGGDWFTTDLFLDLWIPVGSDSADSPRLLDVGELREAEARGWISPRDAERAREEARGLSEAARRGDWPPAIVTRWTRERARAVLDQGAVDPRAVGNPRASGRSRGADS